MGKTRDLFKKIRDTGGIFQAMMCTIKDGNGTDIIEGEDMARMHRRMLPKKKKDLNDPDNLDGVIIHLEPDILECKVKWA